MSQQLLIQNGNTVYEPVIQDEVTWTTERKGAAGKLEFKVVKDNIINFEEGNPVAFRVDNTNLFYGFVFKKKRVSAFHINFHNTNSQLSFRSRSESDTNIRQENQIPIFYKID